MALFEEVKKFLNHLKQNSDLSSKLFEIVEVPQNEIITHFPVEMDNGQYKIFKGYIEGRTELCPNQRILG